MEEQQPMYPEEIEVTTMQQPVDSNPGTLSAEEHTVSQRIAIALQRNGVEFVFGQSLPSALILSVEDLGIRQITYRTENAGGAMADGYARRSNKVGVVTAQNGPAATLLVAPLAEALKASVPLVALVQEVSRGQEDRNAFQDLDHLQLFTGCTKWVRCVREANRVEDYIDMAFVAATTGRPGPVALMLPADLLNEVAPAPQFPRTAELGDWPLDRSVANPKAIARAAKWLSTADNPIVIAGGGIHGSQAANVLSELQEKASLPVATTMMGKGAVDERHALSVGTLSNVMGDRSLGKHVRSLLDKADVVFLIGNRTNQNGTDTWSTFPSSARIIHLDIDGNEVGRTYEALRLVGDAKLTLCALLVEFDKHDFSKRTSSRASIEAILARARAQHQAESESVRTSAARPIRPERVMNEIQSLLTTETTVVADASYSSVWINAYLQSHAAGQRFLSPRGLAGLGWGFPMALGARLANPNAPVICLVGDGGFGHCWAELETARRMGIAVVLIVLNNAVLGYQKDAETVKFGRYTSACHFEPVNHAEIARACGVRAHRIEDPNELARRLEQALVDSDMTLLDVISDPNAYPPLTMFDQHPGATTNLDSD